MLEPADRALAASESRCARFPPDFGATDAGAWSGGRETSVDMFFTAVGLHEAYIHFEIDSAIADREQHRELAVLHGPRFREPVFAQ